MSVRRPRIGVTGPRHGGLAAWLATRFALARCGAQAVRIRPHGAPPPADLDGLVIGGGADVGWQPDEVRVADPAPAAWRWRDVVLVPFIVVLRSVLGKRQDAADNAARDRLELDCLATARRRGWPVLGICRGAQLLNVFLGGRLHRDLAAFYEEGRNLRSVLPRKLVDVVPDSRLARCLGRTRCRVNALHRQAVDDARLGKALVVVAREPNGVVQAIETDGAWPAIGVQWHPEYMPQRREQRRLFACLVALARDAAD
ncbi:MAG: gamma-glutamyl-gamma-aminobutyrate hydrolase family protein [Gammaproteobacteria bacterium]|nr:gamma-glutamyl-gamma-aminobutyrate hydrolase family protein [Gammaproteobacteria bacterium]